MRILAKQNKYKQLQQDRLPGDVPNTPSRRLSFAIRSSVSIRQLRSIYSENRLHESYFSHKHAAAVVMRIPNLIYHKAVGGMVLASEAQELVKAVLALSEELERPEVLRKVEGDKICQLITCFAALRLRPPEATLTALIGELLDTRTRKLPMKHPDLLAELVWSCSTLGLSNSVLWVELRTICMQLLFEDAFGCDNLARLALGFASSNQYDPQLFCRILTRLKPRMPLLSGVVAASIVWSIGHVGHRDVGIANMLLRHLGSRISEVSQDVLVQAVHGYAQLGLTCNEFVSAVDNVVNRNTARFTPQQLLLLLKGLAAYPPAEVRITCTARVARTLRQHLACLSFHDLADLSVSLAALGHVDRRTWTEVNDTAAKICGAASCSDVVKLLVGAAQVRVVDLSLLEAVMPIALSKAGTLTATQAAGLFAACDGCGATGIKDQLMAAMMRCSDKR